jgi:hypothetical protein
LPLTKLVRQDDPAWPLVERAVAESRGRARILPTTRERGEQALQAVQCDTRSFLGAVAYESGGLLVDHGWLRVLGAGGPEMGIGLASVNGLDDLHGLGRDAVGLVVAIDVLGGLFAINAGRLPGARDHVCYLAPDTLDWLDMGCRYSGFIEWATAGKVDEFYSSLRWPGWQREVAALPLDRGLHVVPPLFAEREPQAAVERRAVALDELWQFTVSMSRQLRDKGYQPGEKVRFRIRRR